MVVLVNKIQNKCQHAKFVETNYKCYISNFSLLLPKSKKKIKTNSVECDSRGKGIPTNHPIKCPFGYSTSIYRLSNM